MSEIITCPSGLKGSIRAMLVREERILADRKLAKAGGQVDELLSACWEETLEAGPYDFGDKVIDWGKVLQGDRFFALLKIRALTYGAKYAFSVPCQNDACRARIEWELDLNELPCRPLSDESRAAFTADNRFETVLPDSGKQIWFRLLTGADERRLPQLRRSAGDKLLSAMLAFRVSEIEGVDARERQGHRGADHARRRLPGRRVRPVDAAWTRPSRSVPRVLRLAGDRPPFDRTFFMPAKERTAGAGTGAALSSGEPRCVARRRVPGLLAAAYGGSGLGASMSEVLELPVSDRDWLIERIGQRAAARGSKGLQGDRRWHSTTSGLASSSPRGASAAKMALSTASYSTSGLPAAPTATSAFRQLGIGLAVFTAGAAMVAGAFARQRGREVRAGSPPWARSPGPRAATSPCSAAAIRPASDQFSPDEMAGLCPWRRRGDASSPPAPWCRSRPGRGLAASSASSAAEAVVGTLSLRPSLPIGGQRHRPAAAYPAHQPDPRLRGGPGQGCGQRRGVQPEPRRRADRHGAPAQPQHRRVELGHRSA